MSFLGDLKILYHLTLAPIRGKTHAERLDSFYSGQAEGYDRFRARLLHGRAELWQSIEPPPRGVWIDVGGGTGENIERLGDGVSRLSKVYVVDLAQSLLQVAKKRVADRGWTNVEPLCADATTFSIREHAADVVTFSYSLTMIPDWFAAIDRAYDLLRPGGRIGVVDFYVARKHADAARARHSWFTRTFWPTWFANDNVFPSSDHLPYLLRKFETERLDERFSKVPYLPLIRTPYYIFVGRKPAAREP